MKHIGAHVSTADGIQLAPLEAAAIGAKAFAILTGSRDKWISPPVADEVAEAFRNNCHELGYEPRYILPHANLLINLGGSDRRKLALSRKALEEELNRARALGLTMVNVHPGSHLKLLEIPACLDRIAESVNVVLSKTEGVTVVLENTAGAGTQVGFTFEQLAAILDKVEDKERVGVCIDTCHLFSAGYDFSTPEGYKKTWDDFADTIGFERLRGIHLNDDARACGSHIDRHASIGRGTIGMEFFRLFMADARFDAVPVILETPDPLLWAQEIALLYSLAGGEETKE